PEWKSENGHAREAKEKTDARAVEINSDVHSSNEKEVCFSKGDECFEVRPIKITLSPKLITKFCEKERKSIHKN
ncbi:hypothetical protein WA026_002121, partial [Henosepilachna vigintioctopunctata]